MEKFKASTQYGDFKGTVSSDKHDLKDIYNYVKTHNILADNQNLISIKIYSDQYGINITLLSMEQQDYDVLETSVNPIKVKKTKLNMTIEDFLKLFKRFSICLNSRNVNLEDKEY